MMVGAARRPENSGTRSIIDKKGRIRKSRNGKIHHSSPTKRCLSVKYPIGERFLSKLLSLWGTGVCWQAGHYLLLGSSPPPSTHPHLATLNL